MGILREDCPVCPECGRTLMMWQTDVWDGVRVNHDVPQYWECSHCKRTFPILYDDDSNFIQPERVEAWA